jgi:hypothetical protein
VDSIVELSSFDGVALLPADGEISVDERNVSKLEGASTVVEVDGVCVEITYDVFAKEANLYHISFPSSEL